MANVLVNDASLADIADAIREKNGTEETYKPAEMGDAVRAIESGGTDYLEKRLNQEQYQYNNENVLKIPQSAFSNDTALKGITLQNCTEINAYSFQGCISLEYANLPSLKKIVAGNHFTGCVLLKKLVFNNIETGSIQATNCTSLEYCEYTSVPNIQGNAFGSDSNFKALVIRQTNKIATLLNSNAFSNTLIASGVGYIYVPRALVDTYKTATNWVTYAAQFRALEDYTVDGTITGALDESKI